MSKLTDLLSTVKVYNDYEFFGNEPYMTHASNGGRTVMPPWWAVGKRGVKLSNEWYANGNKLFSHFGGKESKREAFDEASEFMRTEFGIEKLARSPFGGWGDAEFVTKRLKELKELALSASPRKD